MKGTRIEYDLLGQQELPIDAYYGIQTLRAYKNFNNVTGIKLRKYPRFVSSLAMVKYAAAKTNFELGLLDVTIANPIQQACQEIIAGKFHNQFIVDMIQGGAGTSTNMNINEVVANRALEIMGHQKGDYQYCHPNNHVNLSQSTNDVYPTSFRISFWEYNKLLVSQLKHFIVALDKKSIEFKDVVKMGRTQLQDAVPMTLGQEFGAYRATFEEEIIRLTQMAQLFLEVNIGATAIGTGINTESRYAKLCIKNLRDITGQDIHLANNLFEATNDTGACVIYSSALKRLAIKISSVCNDFRLLSSGPRCGLNEINLPPMQPGSSIMPGKVNPVIPELVNQICFKVIGNDMTVTMASAAGQLQLNVMEPVIVYSILGSVKMLRRGLAALTRNCISGITANIEHCRDMVLNSIGIVTALSPVLGYENSSKVAKQALAENKSIPDVILEKKLLTEKEIKNLLSIDKMVGLSR